MTPSTSSPSRGSATGWSGLTPGQGARRGHRPLGAVGPIQLAAHTPEGKTPAVSAGA